MVNIPLYIAGRRTGGSFRDFLTKKGKIGGRHPITHSRSFLRQKWKIAKQNA